MLNTLKNIKTYIIIVSVINKFGSSNCTSSYSPITRKPEQWSYLNNLFLPIDLLYRIEQNI